MNTICEAYSGRCVNLRDPDPAMIEITDIAKSLSRLCRYTGHPRFDYSVAQHSVHCVEYASKTGETDKQILLELLLHDAHEAYMGDITSPTCAAIEMLAPGVIHHIKMTLQAAIVARLRLRPESLNYDFSIDHVDGAMRTIESAILMTSRGSDWENRIRPKVYLHIPIMRESEAEGMFLAMFRSLKPDYKPKVSSDELKRMHEVFRAVRPRRGPCNGVPHPPTPEPIHQSQSPDGE